MGEGACVRYTCMECVIHAMRCMGAQELGWPQAKSLKNSLRNEIVSAKCVYRWCGYHGNILNFGQISSSSIVHNLVGS